MILSTSTPEDVLHFYGVSTRRASGELSFMCPFHPDGSYSASMNINTGLWICHSCGERGNIYQFIAKQEGTSIAQAEEMVFAPSLIMAGMLSEPEEEEDRNVVKVSEVPLPSYAKLYFMNRGFSLLTLKGYGVTYDRNSDRVLLKVSDSRGNVGGTIGRALTSRLKPKYLFSKGLKKGRFLFGHAQALRSCIGTRKSKVLLVEGPLDAMKAAQSRFPAVAVMGAIVSEAQVSLLASSFDYVYIAADVDPAGRELERQVITVLEPIYGNRLKVVPLLQKDVCDCTHEELRVAVRSSYSPLVYDITEITEARIAEA